MIGFEIYLFISFPVATVASATTTTTATANGPKQICFVSYCILLVRLDRVATSWILQNIENIDYGKVNLYLCRAGVCVGAREFSSSFSF